MDTENRLIQYLYGEEARPEDVEQHLASDDALRAEYRQLRAIKKHLDRRTPPRPDAAVIDRIVDAAASASAKRTEGSHREDRSAVREDRGAVRTRRTPQRRVLQAVAALAVLLVGVSVGVWQWEGSTLTEPTTSSEAVSATAGAPAADESIPAWGDEADNVVRLRRHIETLQARSSPTRWDYPGAELQTASQVRPLSNN